MARTPTPGAVKTRLAAVVGDEAAALTYRRLLARTIAGAASVDLIAASGRKRADGDGGVALYLAVDPGPGGADPGSLGIEAEDRWTLLTQTGDTLGERLAGVFRRLFAAGHDPVVIVGSDSPALPTDFLERAFHLLGAEVDAGGDDSPAPDLVLGPAFDGGYYLIGTRRTAWDRHAPGLTALLCDSPMGTAEVADFTRGRAAALGLRSVELPLWTDVDEPRDLPQAETLLGAPSESPTGPQRAALGRHRADASPRPVHEPGSRPERTAAGLREVYLHVTHRCGTGCPQCYLRDARDPGLDRSRELTTDEWRRVIDEAADLGAATFVFIGGDPFLRSDLLDLVEHVTRAREARARLFFNRPVDGETAAALAQAGAGRLTPLLSIDGTEPVNDSLRGAGNHAAAVGSIRALLGAGLRPVVNTVLLRPVLPTLPRLAEELAGEGVGTLHLILPHQRGGLADPGDLVPTGSELLEAVRALTDAAARVGLAVDNLAAWKGRLRAPRDLCGAGCDLLAVDPEGLVHACPITCGDGGFVAGDVRREPLGRIHSRSPVLQLLRHSHARDREECRECPVVDACGGECWVQAHYAARARAERAGYLAPFPYCDLVRPMLEELGAGRCGDAGNGDRAASEVDLTPFDCI